MKKIIFMISLILFTFTIDVKAIDECSSSELARLKELAGNVSFTYDYYFNDLDEEDDSLGGAAWFNYKIEAHNLSEDLKVKIKGEETYFTISEPILDEIGNGITLNVEIYAYTTNLCSGKLLKIETIKLPYFNEYSLREECKEYENFKYCKEFLKLDITDDEFVSEFEKYKEELKNQNQNDLDNDLKMFFNDYGIYIITAIFLVVVAIITFIIVKVMKKDSDL